MMWLLLFSLTGLVVLLPLWPAFEEWRRPQDAAPLHIDADDALDPLFLAHDFNTRLVKAVDSGLQRLGSVEIAVVDATWATDAIENWPLSDKEKGCGASDRIWRCSGAAVLPAGVHFLAEVAAQGDLHSAQDGTYHALWSGGRLQLGPDVKLQRWAHGQQVEVAAGCRLIGRVSAEQTITLRGRSTFSMLHAAQVRFRPVTIRRMPWQEGRLAAPVWPATVRWDPVARRGISEPSIQIADPAAWQGDLVSHGDIRLGPGCQAGGSLKARGAIDVAAGCVVSGSVVAGGAITIGPQCTVAGSVVSETAVMLGAGCTIGAPGRPATVAAPLIDVNPGVVVHGTLWAGRSGRFFSRSFSRTQAGAAALPSEPAMKHEGVA